MHAIICIYLLVMVYYEVNLILKCSHLIFPFQSIMIEFDNLCEIGFLLVSLTYWCFWLCNAIMIVHLKK